MGFWSSRKRLRSLPRTRFSRQKVTEQIGAFASPPLLLTESRLPIEERDQALALGEVAIGGKVIIAAATLVQAMPQEEITSRINEAYWDTRQLCKKRMSYSELAIADQITDGGCSTNKDLAKKKTKDQ